MKRSNAEGNAEVDSTINIKISDLHGKNINSDGIGTTCKLGHN